MTDYSALNKDPYNYANNLEINELTELLEELSDVYHNSGNSVISDQVYDILVRVLEKRDPDNEFLGKTGAPVSKDKVLLPYPMPSLSKIKADTEDLDKWKINFEGPYVVSEKIDGVSALIYKSDDNQLKMYSRGDALYAQDISHLLPYVLTKNVKIHMIVKGGAVRGELVISKKDFEGFPEYKNARNAVAGLVNCKTLEKRLGLAKVTKFVAHSVLFPEMDAMDQFELLKKQGFQVAFNKASHDVDKNYLSELLLDRRANGEYKTDGLVVVDSARFYKITVDYPEHAIAFKMVTTDQVAEATVIDVLWRTSKHGLIKPRVQIEPTKLVDVVIQKLTGFNAKYIVDNNIGPGAIVEIIRSGDVIPKIQKVIQPADSPKLPNFPFKWNDTKVDILATEKDESQVVQQITHFFKTLDIKGVAQGTIAKFVASGYTSIFDIIKGKDKLVKIKGIGQKLVDKMFQGLTEKLAHIPLNVLMAASTVFGTGFGVRQTKIITDAYPNILSSNWTQQEITDKLLVLNGIGPITAKQFAALLPDFIKFYNKLSKLFTISFPQSSKLSPKSSPKSSSNKSFKSSKSSGESVDKGSDESADKFLEQKIVFSGFRNKDWESIITQNQGSVSSAVSKNTTLVVYTNTDTSKYKNAIKLEVATMPKEEFEKKIASL